MINYDSMFNFSSGVTCNWCIQIDAPQSLALKFKVVSPNKDAVIVNNIY